MTKLEYCFCAVPTLVNGSNLEHTCMRHIQMYVIACLGVKFKINDIHIIARVAKKCSALPHAILSFSLRYE